MIYSLVLLFMFYLYLVWKKTENIQIVKRSPPITYVLKIQMVMVIMMRILSGC